jgi:hypothetical protein
MRHPLLAVALLVVGVLLTGFFVARSWPEPSLALPALAGGSGELGAAELATGRLSEPADAGGGATPTVRDGVAFESGWLVRVQAVDALGEPVPAATITLRRAGEAEPFAQLAADANGSWSGPVSGAPIVVSAVAECVGRSIAFEVTPARAELGTVVLLLGRPVLVTGLVVDDGGRAIVGDRIVICDHTDFHAGHAQGLSAREVRSDASGRFAVETMAGVLLQFSRKAAPDDAAWVTAVDGASAVVAPFGTFRVQVRVRAANGEPVPAALSSHWEKRRNLGMMVPDWGQPDSGVEAEEVAPGELRLKIPGSVSFDRWLLVKGYAPLRIRFPALSWPSTVQHVDAWMMPLVSTWLRVDCRGAALTANREGKQPDHAYVSWWPASPQLADSTPVPFNWRMITIDGDGLFEVQLPFGSEWMACVGDGLPVCFQGGDRDVVLAPIQSTERPHIELQVFRQDGVLLTDPALRFHRDRLSGGVDGEDHASIDVAVKGYPNARFPFDDARGVIVVTDLASQQVAAVEIRRDGPERIPVVLQPPTELVVRVRCGSRPARGVHVHVTSFGEPHLERLDADGCAVLRTKPGPAVVQVRRAEEVLVERAVMLSSGRFELELPVVL